MADESRAAAVYVSWSTFKNALESLAQGIPKRVDRSAFSGLAWGVQSQLLTGMKFMGLLNEDGSPTPALHEVAVVDEEARKEKLRTILRERYADLFALDLMKVTPAHLAEQMGISYNVAGATRDKAVRFFLSAVEYVGIPVSHLFKPKGSNGGVGAGRKRRVPRTRMVSGSPDEEAPPMPADEPAMSGHARVVKLTSGGTLTIRASLDLFSLNPSDREFVFGLIDKLEEYERKAGAAPAS